MDSADLEVEVEVEGVESVCCGAPRAQGGARVWTDDDETMRSWGVIWSSVCVCVCTFSNKPPSIFLTFSHAPLLSLSPPAPALA